MQNLSNPSKVIFSAIRKKESIGSNQVITYTTLEVDIHSQMNIRTGTFHVQISGTYQFTFSALTGDSAGYVEVYVMKNDVKIFHIEDGNSGGQNNNIAYVWMMVLEANDQIKLMVGQHQIHVCGSDPIHFTGQLLSPT